MAVQPDVIFVLTKFWTILELLGLNKLRKNSVNNRNEKAAGSSTNKLSLAKMTLPFPNGNTVQERAQLVLVRLITELP